MKAIIWGSCGSLPSPASSAAIRAKVKSALWQARDLSFDSEAAVDRYLDTLPHSITGTYKANTSCVQIEADTEDVVLCDAGTGLRDYALSLGPNPPPRTYHIFISHLHWDHIQGFPFFTPAFLPGNRIIFHGFHPEIESALRQQMQPPCFPVPFETMQAAIEFDIREEGAHFQIGGLCVRTIRQQHPGDSWGYRFEQHGKSIVYSSDSEHGPEAKAVDYAFVDFFAKADVLIFDGQYTLEEARNDKRHWGHSDNITAIELGARAQVRHLVVFHHEPAHSDLEIEQLHLDAERYRDQFNRELDSSGRTQFPETIQLAYDGLVLET